MDEPKTTDIPGPNQDNKAFFASCVLIVAVIAVVVALGLYYGPQSQQHIDELEPQGYKLPDAPVNDQAPAAIMQMIIADPVASRVPVTDTGDTATPLPETPVFSMGACDKWPEEARFECERHPEVPEECCTGC